MSAAAVPLTLCWLLSCYFSARAGAPCAPVGGSKVFPGTSIPQYLCLEEKECGLACWLGLRRSFGAGRGRGRGRLRRGLLLALCSLLLHSKALPSTFGLCSHVLGALTARKLMGSPRLAALLLCLCLLFIGLSASSGIGCPCLPHWNTRCLLASHMVRCQGRNTRLAQAGKAPHSPACAFLSLQVPVLWWQPQCVLYTILEGW